MNQLKQPRRYNLVIEFIIPEFIEGSTCFERHTAPTVSTQPGQRPVTTWVYKPEAANTV